MAINIDHESDSLNISGSELSINVPINSSNLKKNNWGASIAPTVDDDIDLGYEIGSRWINISTDNEWVCTDNTDGAAVWVESTPNFTGDNSSVTSIIMDIDSDNDSTIETFIIRKDGTTEIFKVAESGAVTFNQAYTFPTTDGSTDYILQTNGAGVVTWVAATSGDPNYVSESTPGVAPVATGSDALSMGDSSTSVGTNSISIGVSTDAYEIGCIAIGLSAQAGTSGGSTGWYTIGIGSGANASNYYSIAMGWNSGARASYSIGIGASSSSRESNTIAIGGSSQAGQTVGGTVEEGAIAIGSLAKAYETRSIAIGYAAVAGVNSATADPYSIALGANTTAAHQYSIALGYRATTTAENQLVIGGGFSSAYIDDVYYGRGVASSTPVAITINPNGGSGTNVAGGSMTIAGGKSTGSGAGGNILFKTSTPGGSGSAANALVEAMRIDDYQNVEIGIAALGTTATDGFLYIPTCAGTPTGTPTTKTGLAPMVYDSTNNKFWMYDGSWIGIALT